MVGRATQYKTEHLITFMVIALRCFLVFEKDILSPSVFMAGRSEPCLHLKHKEITVLYRFIFKISRGVLF